MSETKRGRPPKPPQELKVNKSIRLHPETWARLALQAYDERVTIASLIERWADLGIGPTAARDLRTLAQGRTPDEQLRLLLVPWDVGEIPGASGPWPSFGAPAEVDPAT